MNTVYQDLQELRGLVASPYTCKEDNRRLRQMIQNHDPSGTYRSNPKYRRRKISDLDIIHSIPKYLLAVVLVPLVLKILLVILCFIIYLFTPDSKAAEIKASIYSIPYSIGNLLLGGSDGFLSSFFFVTLTGLFCITFVLILAVFFIKLFYDIKKMKKQNIERDELRAEERSVAMDFRNRAQANPALFDAYRADIEREINANYERERNEEKRRKELIESTNLPPQYANPAAIDMIMQYIRDGRAQDVIGAINQIHYDSVQQQILAEAQATRVAQERTAAAQAQTARAAERAAFEAEQANMNYWIDRANRK